jgi:hypothetical protein
MKDEMKERLIMLCAVIVPLVIGLLVWRWNRY